VEICATVYKKAAEDEAGKIGVQINGVQSGGAVGEVRPFSLNDLAVDPTATRRFLRSKYRLTQRGEKILLSRRLYDGTQRNTAMQDLLASFEPYGEDSKRRIPTAGSELLTNLARYYKWCDQWQLLAYIYAARNAERLVEAMREHGWLGLYARY
jgi:hypothetical protein